ncbi:MAG: ion channel [Chloroflexota bacterium]|nr:ion channel [Chloroflexota bacterium]
MARPLKGDARHRFLGLAIPLLIVGLMASWVLLLLFAFGLIYAAWIAAPGAFRTTIGGSTPEWGDALYFSGITLATVGYGDFQPVHVFLRVVAIIEGFSGVAVISLSIAYVLEIYPIIQRKRVLAVLLNEETAGQVSALPLLVRYLRNNNFEALADLLRLINMEMLTVAEAHRRLPVLHYSHPVEVERSFLRVLLVVRNLVATLRYGVASGRGIAWSQDPRVRGLEDTLFYTLHTLGSSLHLPLGAAPDGEEHEQRIEATFQELCDRLLSYGLPSPGRTAGGAGASSEFDAVYASFHRFYTVTEAPLTSYLRNSGYTLAEATEVAARPQQLVSELEVADILRIQDEEDD